MMPLQDGSLQVTYRLGVQKCKGAKKCGGEMSWDHTDVPRLQKYALLIRRIGTKMRPGMYITGDSRRGAGLVHIACVRNTTVFG